MWYSESWVLFWTPCENRTPGKPLVYEIMSRERPQLTRFLWFLAILNEPFLEKYMSDQYDFWILKELLEDYLPWKNEPQRFSSSWYMSATVSAVFEWSKMDFALLCFALYFGFLWFPLLSRVSEVQNGPRYSIYGHLPLLHFLLLSLSLFLSLSTGKIQTVVSSVLKDSPRERGLVGWRRNISQDTKFRHF